MAETIQTTEVEGQPAGEAWHDTRTEVEAAIEADGQQGGRPETIQEDGRRAKQGVPESAVASWSSGA